MSVYTIKSCLVMMLAVATLGTHAQVLKISSGTQIVNNGSMTLASTNLSNDGTFQNNNGANVIFSGPQNVFIYGNGNTSFYGLELNKTSDNLAIQKNIKVAGSLKFTKGSLDVGINSLQLIYPDGLLQNESEQNRAFATGGGFLFIEQPLNAPNNVNPGNLGFRIFSSQNLGSTVVYRGHEAQDNGGQQSIKRYFSIVPANNANLNAFMQFTYFDAELNGLSEADCRLHEKEGAGSWTMVNITGSNVAANYYERSFIPSLHKYTLFAPAQAPLPLKLLAFDVRCQNSDAILQWITANEVNTKAFVIEQSINGVTWTTAQTIVAKSSSGQHTYTTTLANNGASYYRLKMEDKDGKFTYSPIKKINCDSRDVVTVGPNPTTSALTISFQLQKKTDVIVRLLDARGSLLESKKVVAMQGLSVERMNLSKYPAGSYMVTLSYADGMVQTHRIVKQ